MTSLNAASWHRDRGLLRAGLFADITVFDASRISDRATYAEPFNTAKASNIIVNGQIVIDKAHTGAGPAVRCGMNPLWHWRRRLRRAEVLSPIAREKS
jgi:N-acyl-D-aspartate/D-glutamate deacylase